MTQLPDRDRQRGAPVRAWTGIVTEQVNRTVEATQYLWTMLSGTSG